MARRSRGECFVAVAGARGYTCCWPGSAGQDPVLVGHRAGAEGYGHLAGERLLTYLKQTAEGEIADTGELEKLLAECWEEFAGDYGGMEPYKLLGRMEDVVWSPPILEFVIERHGGTAMGSYRAELQHWVVDVEHKTVKAHVKGYRQISPRAAPLDVKPIAEEIVHLILNRTKDDRLKWSRKGHVQVLIGKILPEGSAVKRTLVGRRSRLSYATKEKLTAHGWREISHGWYAPPNHAG